MKQPVIFTLVFDQEDLRSLYSHKSKYLNLDKKGCQANLMTLECYSFFWWAGEKFSYKEISLGNPRVLALKLTYTLKESRPPLLLF